MNALPPLLRTRSHEWDPTRRRFDPVRMLIRTAGQMGAVVAGAPFVGLVYFLIQDMRGVHFSAVRGLFVYVVLPGVMVSGLAVMAFAAWWGSREARRRSDGEPPRRRTPTALAMFSVAGLAMVLVLGAAGFRAVEFMESTTFCGTCHTVMQPQFEAHEISPHAEVACTKCHIGPEAGPVGPGAAAYMEAKIGGLHQTLSVLRDDYDRPIHAPEGKIKPATETCNLCHAPDKNYGVTVREYSSILPDESNTAHRRALAFRVGGGGEGSSPSIHWHATARVWYTATDETRQSIASAGVETESGVVEWTNPGVETPPLAARRLMDCTDCHNRVGHEIPFPGTLLDQAFRDGTLDASLPYLKREALALLGADADGGNVDAQASRVASPGWFDELRRFYEREYPEIAATRGADIDAAIAELKRISSITLYPEMRTDWATYPDNLQHSLPDGLDLDATGNPGCFRCHGTLVNENTGEKLAGTMGGEGCMACHGFGEGEFQLTVPQEAVDPNGCGLCHISLSDEQMDSWLPKAEE